MRRSKHLVIQRSGDRRGSVLDATKRFWQTEEGAVTKVNSDGTYNVNVGGRPDDWEHVRPICKEAYVVTDNVVLGFMEGQRNLPFIVCKTKWISSGKAGGSALAAMLAGQWGQSWGNYTRNAISDGSANLKDNWPGVEAFDFSGSGIEKATGLVVNATGRYILARNYNHAGTWKFRVTLLNPLSNPWASLAEDMPVLSNVRDQGGSGYQPDSQCFYDAVTDTLTAFPRIAQNAAGSTTDKATAYVSKCPAASLSAHLDEIIVSQAVDAGYNYTATAMSVAGTYMFKANMTENASGSTTPDAYVFLYQQNADGIWSPGTKINWLQRLFDKGFLSDLGGNPGYFPSNGWTVGMGAQASGESSAAGQNYGAPFIQNGKVALWCTLVVALRRHSAWGIADGFTSFDQIKLMEVRFEAKSGTDIHSVVPIYLQDIFLQSAATVMSNALTAAAAQAVIDDPGLAPSSSSTNVDTICGSTPVSYTRVEDRLWLGVMYESYEIDNAYWNSFSAKIYYPGFESFVTPPTVVAGTIPTRTSNTPMGVVHPGLNSRYISTKSGWRYGSFSRNLPLLVPSDNVTMPIVPPGGVARELIQALVQSNAGGGISEFPDALERRENLSGCTYLTHERRIAGFLPYYAFALETVLFAISPTNTVSQLVLPGQRHNIWSEDPNVPFAEQVYQVIVAEELGVALWLHGSRDALNRACTAPMISVTPVGANIGAGVIYTIPASEFFPLTTFASDQVFESNTWASAGEYQHYMLGVSGAGPHMKAMRKLVGSGYEYWLILGVEYYTRVEPNPGSSGGPDLEEYTDNITFEESQDEDGITFTINEIPLGGTVDSVIEVYLNEDPEQQLSFTWDSDVTITLDNPINPGDFITVHYWVDLGSTPPSPAAEGTTTAKAVILKFTATGYSIEKVHTTTLDWTYPDIKEIRDNGQNIMRLMAIGSDRVAYIKQDIEGDSGLRKVFEVT